MGLHATAAGRRCRGGGADVLCGGHCERHVAGVCVDTVQRSERMLYLGFEV